MSRRKPAPDLIRGGRRFAVKDMRQSARMSRRKPAPDLIRGGHRFVVKDMRHSMSEARCAAERECAMVRVPRLTGRGRRVVGRQLRNAVLIGTSVMAIGALSCTGA